MENRFVFCGLCSKFKQNLSIIHGKECAILYEAENQDSLAGLGAKFG